MIKRPSVGASRSVFPVCPKDNALPKCVNCHSLLRSADCPLGRDYPSNKALRIFGKYALAFGGCDEAEDVPEILERIKQMDMPSATLPDPNTHYIREIMRRRGKSRSGR